MIQRTPLRRALMMSAVLHAITAIAWSLIAPASAPVGDLVDIEIAPPVPMPEALPPEVARPPMPDVDRKEDLAPASTEPNQPGDEVAEASVDAGVDAAVDAPPDARPDARPDAGPDAAIDIADVVIDAAPDGTPETVAEESASLDAGVPEDVMVASATHDGGDGGDVTAGGDGDAGSGVAGEPQRDAGDDAVQVAVVEPGDAAREGDGAGSDASPASIPSTATDGSGSGAVEPPLDTGALAAALAAESGVPGTTDQPAVDGAPTTAGTAANLLTYFPEGHVVTAIVRFDRLRGTEWSAQTERLLRPMPDYRMLFGARDASITDKLETLVISSPRPRDAAATTLVARTQLARPELRDFLAAGAPVTWSPAKGGLLGKRTTKLFPGDQRVFLSPFKGWFLLAQPTDLGGLTAAAKGNPNTIEATGKLPPWLAGIRKIEGETGDPLGPALVVTLGLSGQRVSLASYAFGIGISSLPTPERASLAMELVKQGWLVRGNLRFASEADAAELIASVQQVQKRVADSPTIQILLSKPLARVIASLAFARNGARVSYATSISIADARAILAAAALQLDQYFRRPP